MSETLDLAPTHANILQESQPAYYLPAHPDARRLTAQEVAAYHEKGYLKNLPVLGPEAVRELQQAFQFLLGSLPDEIEISRVNNWHKANRWINDLTRHPVILAYVEGLLGPDFYHWGAQFFVKKPGHGMVVPMHQDGDYWPLEPHLTTTVWLAFYDTDAGNGAMKVLPGSHRQGAIDHQAAEDVNSVLGKQIRSEDIDEEQLVHLDLKAGEISLHTDQIIHGSEPNRSDRIRVGLALRYSPCEVRCDLSKQPTFESYQVHGVDQLRLNPVGKIPREYGYPTTTYQPSSVFE